ncbi:MAG: GDSL-type esterase/lipase family protein [Oscillospiraceae bacterium]|nr:GDSL-type esterase/lipase family protein [Oscillospiraceae bacterium]
METQPTWVEAWGMAHARLSMMSFFSAKRTLRLVFNTAISGEGARIRLGNRHSAYAVAVGRANIALCDANGVIADTHSIRPLTFKGKPGLTLPPGGSAISDEAAFAVPAGAHVCVSLYIEKGRLQSGNCLDNARLLCARGDVCGAPAIRHRRRVRDFLLPQVNKLLGLTQPFPIPLFQAVELLNTEGAASIQCFGDSLTQQGFWTKPFEEKIRALYPGRYSVINKAIGGNRILRGTSGRFPLRGYYGVKGLERVHDDVFAYEGVSHVILSLGINDLFQPGTISACKSEFATAEEIMGGAEALAAMMRERGLRVVGLNFVPVGLAADATPEKNALRTQLNELFESSGAFDHKCDISTPFASPENPGCPPPAFVGGDKLHPNGAGGRAIAGAIDCGVFG